MREKLKLYYCCRFTQLSPLRLSGGKNDRTDNDLMLDSRGLPMIPGSALAGVLRGRLTREEANLLFGRDTVGDAMTESAVLVGDVALPADAKVRFTHRDGVGLDEHKVAVPKAKYDFETAECSAPYTAVIEWSGWMIPRCRYWTTCWPGPLPMDLPSAGARPAGMAAWRRRFIKRCFTSRLIWTPGWPLTPTPRTLLPTRTP